MNRTLPATLLLWSILLASSCSTGVSPTTTSASLDQFVQDLRQQGLTVSFGGQISPENNRFFSVRAQEVRVNDGQVNVFVYRNSEAAAAEAAQISADGQPSRMAIVDWVSTPHFYRQREMIVLYVGCSVAIIEALQRTLGNPIAVGRNSCNIAR